MKKFPAQLLFIVFLSMIFIGLGAVNAATFTVTKIADTNDGSCNRDCSLREAIAAANVAATADNLIVFDNSLFSSVQTITLSLGHLPIDRGILTINGTGNNRLTISGNNQSRIFAIASSANLVLNDIKIANGNSAGTGGGIYSLGGSLTVNNSSISNNRAENGAGIYFANGGILNIINSNINANIANGGIFTNKVGGVFIGVNSTANIIGTNVFGNTGSGIYAQGARLAIDESNISGNSAQQGGGIFNGSGTLTTITNTTINGNLAELGGGGISNIYGTLTLTNLTVTDNRTLLENGGGIRNYNGTVEVQNTILSDNIADTSLGSDFGGVMNSKGYNLIKNAMGITFTNITTGNIIGVDPQLLPLGNYGGVTQTRALRPSSPAIDKAAQPNFTTTLGDQRGVGFGRYDFSFVANAPGGNGYDIGAFELQYFEISNRQKFDFDGDRRTDISVYRGYSGEWWLKKSSDGTSRVTNFGEITDKIIPGDYTGDGRDDIAIFRASTSEWFILRSEDESYYSFPFGAAGDIPMPADYDRDTKTDPAVFRPSTGTWFINKSTGGTQVTAFGTDGDIPVPADYDGDGYTDIAIFRPSTGTWWRLNFSQEVSFSVFGTSTDKPVSADYTGDGKADLAFFRPSTGEWFILNADGNNFTRTVFGTATDVPIPADYDGDSKSDIAIFRPTEATWYMQRSTAGFMALQFGFSTDRAVPSAFVP